MIQGDPPLEPYDWQVDRVFQFRSLLSAKPLHYTHVINAALSSRLGVSSDTDFPQRASTRRSIWLSSGCRPSFRKPDPRDRRLPGLPTRELRW